MSRKSFAVLLALLMALAVGGMGAAPAHAKPLASDLVDGFTPAELEVPVQAMPDVSMMSGALVTEDGRILWARKPDQKRAMASITKIMTAVIALEDSSLDDKVVVGRSSASIGESTAFLRTGDRLTMAQLLEALLVKSGNDAAVAIAEHVAGGEDQFVKRMNDKAKELGLEHTNFTNPHGLDASGHYTTATDLAVLARYAMTKPEFRRIVGQKTAVLGSGKHTDKVENTNLLIGNYRGANGIKTGFTSKAGYCVIDSADRDNIELYAVVLGTKSELQRFRDARELLDWGYAHYRLQQLASKGTVVGEAPVVDYLDRAVGAEISVDASVAVMDVAGPISRQVTLTAVDAPVSKGERVGVATYTQRGQVIASVPLVAVEEIPEPNPLQKLGIAIMRGWRRLTGADGAQPAVGTTGAVFSSVF